jgi:hypothetical protein
MTHVRFLEAQLLVSRTVNAECYQNIPIQFIALMEADERDLIFQHAGTTCHTAGTRMALL